MTDKEHLYFNEIKMAKQFLLNHSTDTELLNFEKTMRAETELTHSERWSRCYEFLKSKYPDILGNVITGMAYYLELEEEM